MCEQNPECGWQPSLTDGMAACLIHHVIYPEAEECSICEREALPPEEVPA